MTGGILQLVAKGVHDLFLTDNPNITYFKIVYRRHTNFSKFEKLIKFPSDMNFGKDGETIIGKKGDLIGNMHLVVDLPNLVGDVKGVTKFLVSNILAEYGIIWNFDGNGDDIITEDYYNTFIVPFIIQPQIDELAINIDNLKTSLKFLDDYNICYEEVKRILDIPKVIYLYKRYTWLTIQKELNKVFNVKFIIPPFVTNPDAFITNSDMELYISPYIISRINNLTDCLNLNLDDDDIPESWRNTENMLSNRDLLRNIILFASYPIVIENIENAINDPSLTVQYASAQLAELGITWIYDGLETTIITQGIYNDIKNIIVPAHMDDYLYGDFIKATGRDIFEYIVPNLLDVSTADDNLKKIYEFLRAYERDISVYLNLSSEEYDPREYDIFNYDDIIRVIYDTFKNILIGEGVNPLVQDTKLNLNLEFYIAIQFGDLRINPEIIDFNQNPLNVNKIEIKTIFDNLLDKYYSTREPPLNIDYKTLDFYSFYIIFFNTLSPSDKIISTINSAYEILPLLLQYLQNSLVDAISVIVPVIRYAFLDQYNTDLTEEIKFRMIWTKPYQLSSNTFLGDGFFWGRHYYTSYQNPDAGHMNSNPPFNWQEKIINDTNTTPYSFQTTDGMLWKIRTTGSNDYTSINSTFYPLFVQSKIRNFYQIMNDANQLIYNTGWYSQWRTAIHRTRLGPHSFPFPTWTSVYNMFPAHIYFPDTAFFPALSPPNNILDLLKQLWKIYSINHVPVVTLMYMDEQLTQRFYFNWPYDNTSEGLTLRRLFERNEGSYDTRLPTIGAPPLALAHPTPEGIKWDIYDTIRNTIYSNRNYELIISYAKSLGFEPRYPHSAFLLFKREAQFEFLNTSEPIFTDPLLVNEKRKKLNIMEFTITQFINQYFIRINTVYSPTGSDLSIYLNRVLKLEIIKVVNTYRFFHRILPPTLPNPTFPAGYNLMSYTFPGFVTPAQPRLPPIPSLTTSTNNFPNATAPSSNRSMYNIIYPDTSTVYFWDEFLHTDPWNPTPPIFGEGLSSLYDNFLKIGISQYNTLFNDLLDKAYFDANFGITTSAFMNRFFDILAEHPDYTLYDIINKRFDYYYDATWNGFYTPENKIQGFLNEIDSIIPVFNQLLLEYAAINSLLNIINTDFSISKERYYFENSQDIYAILYKKIVNSPTLMPTEPLYKYIALEILDKFIDIFIPIYQIGNRKYPNTRIVGVKGAMDMLNSLTSARRVGIDDTAILQNLRYCTGIDNIDNINVVDNIFTNNPFNLPFIEKQRNLWWNSTLKDKPLADGDILDDIFTQIVENILPINFYTTEYRFKFYNNFDNAKFLIKYLTDIILQKSTIGDLLVFVEDTWEDTYKNLRDIILTIYEDRLEQIKKVAVYDSKTKKWNYKNSELYLRFKNIFFESKGNPRFAWADEIGLYLIDKIGIYINDQLIDEHNGEFLRQYTKFYLPDEHKRSYDIMIGNIPELYQLNFEQKQKYRLYIPLKFWFCRHFSAVLPGLALQHADIKIRLKIRDLDEGMFKQGELSYFIKKPQLNCQMLVDYYYVEKDERKAFSENKHEYLIERTRINTQNTFTGDDILHDNILKIQLYFKNPVKLLIWTIRLTDENGIIPNPANWTNYSYVPNLKKYYKYIENDNLNYKNTNGNLQVIRTFKLFFNGKERETEKDYQFNSLITPHLKFINSLDDNVFVYSFSIFPELLQPSGTANFSKLNEVFINMKLAEPYVRFLKEHPKAKIFWNVYSVSYDVLRVMSGLSGLAFFD